MTRTVLVSLLIGLATVLNAQKQATTEIEKLGADKFNEAIKAYAANDYAKSILLFTVADSLIGSTELVDRVKLRFALGTCYLETGQPGKALEYFEWVAGRDSTYPYVYFQAGESALKEGQSGKALQYFRKALPAAGQDQRPIILGRVGELELKAGRAQAALKALDEGIFISKAANLYLLRGQALDALAQPIDKAEDNNFSYEKAIQDGKITEELMNEAIKLRERALDDYEAAAENPKLAAACDKLIKRSNIILENNRKVVSEIRYQRENP